MTRATCVTSGLPNLRTGWTTWLPLPDLLLPNAFLKAVTRFLSSGASFLGSELLCSWRSAIGKQAVSFWTNGEVHKHDSCCLTKGVVSWTSNIEVDFSVLENQPRIGCHCVRFDCLEATYRWQCSSNLQTKHYERDDLWIIYWWIFVVFDCLPQNLGKSTFPVNSPLPFVSSEWYCLTNK